MIYKIGMVLEGKVTGIQPYGAFVTLDEHTQGLIHISECHHGYVEKISEYLKIGQKVKVMIIDIDEYTQKISLSIRCLERGFDFSHAGERARYQHKKFWTNKKVQEGFNPIAKNLNRWVEAALVDIEAGK
ncbi:CvfD/Ygs/GSP13 family RNA-binding post-transcriptional regulator [Ligilactobacillus equi]|uniref:Polyribonucleotide nucleotidyltransferase n=2 Tax=Ligilactobacillus equi TaxID=137357 RepID=V7HXI1_9LACO|nr:CvfD/Ygs/GSP13 family RNA-binding post-transcriptional regulator [Ligilactobacillus equi]ETA73995.1 polyribonucleotide nucleotidyltransferase [Ligilactobacillus equi DPC 6820]KRL81516.1 polyribonucleotide nucleotidyltransferase [Ligilactobacillus equi DSM 15833 = JCM 10991]MCQ2383042.1 CvfD/Ygs/GSP13 family RNA-binding post-transcriptional regulator [Clostridia bacterium]MCQ2556781.1 CvfD/Ygs/GSP13 family RNA-binding post-transcriptional regulator [Ligilactobacillus sp.]